MLSAKAQEIDRAMGLKVGANDYLSKPASPSEIISKIKSLLAQTSLSSSVREQGNGQR